MRRAFLQIILLCCLVSVLPVAAETTQTLKAKMTDIEGRPLEGGKLFLYDSTNVRRPADFISNVSDRGGQIQISLPPGKYWGVARFKSDGKYGPLMPGDKHSGEPLEIDMTAGGAEADFVVADIRELGQKKRASATDALRIKGRILDPKGEPVADAFVFVGRSKEFAELPDFISAWSGDDGGYELYLPPGATYYAGVSRHFPLNNREGVSRQVMIELGKIDIAIDIDLTVE